MSCKHGNHESACEYCEAEDAIYEQLERERAQYRQCSEALNAALERERVILQSVTDPENQPSQFGTVTIDYMQHELAAALERIERLEKDCDAADLYGRNAAGMGFGSNAPRWSELADETRQLWREQLAKREPK